MAQSPTIDQKWKQIDKEIENGQFKSIQPKIDEIKTLSRKGNDQQSIMAFQIAFFCALSLRKKL